MLLATKEHCFACFETLICHLNERPLPEGLEVASVPLFVTWKKKGRLRGCIGNLSPVSFPNGLHEYAILAATQDKRFPKMKLKELPECTVEVSLLVNFEPGLSWDDWTPGLHGIILQFTVNDEHFKATFLPEVAREQNWSVRETIETLARKSGYNGKIDDSLLKKMKIERYQSSKCEASYLEWIEFKKKDKVDFSTYSVDQ